MNSVKSNQTNGRDEAEDDEVVGENMDILQPQQKESERRQIRQRYRDFIEDMQKTQHDLINPESDAINERLREVDELYKPVRTAREAALDSCALAMIANYGRQKAQALHTEFVKFQPVEFAEKLVNLFGSSGAGDMGNIPFEGWVQMGENIRPYFNRSPAFHFMAGSFEKEVQKRRPTPKEPKDKSSKDEKDTVPTQLRSFEEQQKNEATTAEVERVLAQLQKYYEESEKNPICFFEFILNPHSFGQTIENLFYSSFLIRDGYAKIFIDEDGLPVIEPVEKPEEETAHEKQKHHQTVVTLTPQEWKELLKVYEIKTPMIPTRTVEPN
ncbi:hypothetical protein ScPMuIL_005335 [Solemya velum]